MRGPVDWIKDGVYWASGLLERRLYNWAYRKWNLQFEPDLLACGPGYWYIAGCVGYEAFPIRVPGRYQWPMFWRCLFAYSMGRFQASIEEFAEQQFKAPPFRILEKT